MILKMYFFLSVKGSVGILLKVMEMCILFEFILSPDVLDEQNSVTQVFTTVKLMILQILCLCLHH